MFCTVTLYKYNVCDSMNDNTLRMALLLVIVVTAGFVLASTGVAGTTESAVAQSNDSDSDDWFNVEPSTSIHTPHTTVTEDQEAIIELSISNPSLNDKAVVAEVSGSYPSGTSVTGENLVSVGGGQFSGSVTVEPGGDRTITVRLAPNELGDFTVDGSYMYTHEDTDRISQSSLQRPFDVEGLPDIDGDDVVDDDDDVVEDDVDDVDDDDDVPIVDGESVSAGLIGLVAVLFLGVSVVVYARQSGAEVEIQE